MVKNFATKSQIMELLSGIPDPEIPVVNIQEIGMLRDVVVTSGGYEIILSPTYSGCPAMAQIEQDILALLGLAQIAPARVTLSLDPAWTTDWMSAAAKEKLRKYGIAPPLHSSCSHLAVADSTIHCPICNSPDTTVISQFGSTPCKALYRCNGCLEPFEYFKCH